MASLGAPRVVALALVVTSAWSLCTSPDWLVCAPHTPVAVSNWSVGSIAGITLSNGLVSRSWATTLSGSPAFALWDYRSLLDSGWGQSIVRSLNTEAAVTLNESLVFSLGGAETAGHEGPANWTQVGTDQAAGCAFVGQGPTDSLAACEAACWASSSCDAVNWIAAVPPSKPNDCVLRACQPGDWALTPYPGCDVWATFAAPARASVSQGPFLNRSGLTDAGVLAPAPSAFGFAGWTTSAPAPRFAWTAGRRGSPPETPWPPPGLTLTAHFVGTGAAAGVLCDVVYEMYVGSASVSKWVVVWAAAGGGAAGTTLDGVEVERLGVSPEFSPLAPLPYAAQFETPSTPLFPGAGRLGILVDLHFAGWVRWTNDDLVDGTSGSSQPLLVVTEFAEPHLAFPLVPGGDAWTSLRVYELLFDDGPEVGVAMARYPSSESYWGCTLGPCTPGTGNAIMGGLTERRGLSLRRFVATIAPQGLENPLQNHLTASDSASVRAACDDMASVGYELLVMSYSSGFDVESSDPAYMARIAADIAYCRGKQVEVGGYDLIGWSRNPGRGWAALSPSGSDEGNACFGSGWQDFLYKAFLGFSNTTGLSMLETDGPYGGYGCNNASHTGHTAQTNSVARQSRAQGALYSAMQSAGIYINAPDSWFAWGISKMGIGYNEGTFRLRDPELITLVQRQVIFDATYYTVSSMAWSQAPDMAMFDYTSAFDLVRFEASLTGQLAFGIGTSVSQSPGGRFVPNAAAGAILSKWAAWFKTFRTLLSAGDVIHVSRPDGQDLDVIVRARATDAVAVGMVLVTNPTPDTITASALTIPLHYTGAAPGSTVFLTWGDGGARQPLALDSRSRGVLVGLAVPGRSLLWATVALQ